MADFYQEIQNDQDSLEELVRKLPGFKGYLAKEDRRAADRLLREHLVRVFEEQRDAFTRLQRDLIDAGRLDVMEQVQHIDVKLSSFIDRIRTASQGYAGLFDAIKFQEDDLQRLYGFDYALLGYQDQLQAGLHGLADAIPSDEDVKPILRQIEDIIVEATNTFKRRADDIQSLEADDIGDKLG